MELRGNDRGRVSSKVRQNEKSFLCRLPVELLHEVMRICHQFEPPRYGRWHWILFAQTCHRVRSVALACPSLWAEPEFGRSLAWAREMLKRSKDVPLRIFVYNSRRRFPPKMRTVILKVLKNASRITTLRLNAELEDMDIFVQVLTQPAPHLHSLELQADTVSVLPFPENFLGGHTPLLKTVKLSYCGVPYWEMEIFRNLTTLEVKGPHSTATIPQIITVLRRCPLLETLVLHSALADSMDDLSILSYQTASRSSHPVVLSKLKILDIRPLTSVTQLLYSITIPSAATIRIVTHTGFASTAPFFTALNSCTDPSSPPHLHLPSTWEFYNNHGPILGPSLNILGWPQARASTEPHLKLSFFGNPAERQATVAQMAGALSMQQIQNLRFTGDLITNDIPTDNFDVLEQCTQLSSLYLAGAYKDFFRHLGSRKDEGGMARTMVFPHLWELFIVKMQFTRGEIDVLQEVLQFRDSNNARISRLVFEGCVDLSQEIVDHLSHVDCVVWEGIEKTYK